MFFSQIKHFSPALFLSVALGLTGCSDGSFGRGVGPITSSDQRINTMRAKLARNPKDSSALIAIGREHARQGKWDFAAGAYNEALVVAPGNREARLGYSVSQTALGRYGQALQHAQAALTTKRDTQALVAQGMALNGLGKRAEARAAFDAAVALAPRDLNARSNLSISLALAGDPRAYNTARAVAFAPEADPRHRRNFFLVAAIAGQEAAAKNEGSSLGVPAGDIAEIFAIGRRARSQGVAAFGMATLL